MTQEPESGAGNPPPDAQTSAAESPPTVASALWKGINFVAALLALVIMFASIALAPEIGVKGAKAQGWQLAGLFFLALMFIGVFRKLTYSLLYLMFACAFFFTSCAANFHWKG